MFICKMQRTEFLYVKKRKKTNHNYQKTKVEQFWYTDANFVQFVCIACVLLFCKDGTKESVYPVEPHCVEKYYVRQKIVYLFTIFT